MLGAWAGSNTRQGICRPPPRDSLFSQGNTRNSSVIRRRAFSSSDLAVVYNISDSITTRLRRSRSGSLLTKLLSKLTESCVGYTMQYTLTQNWLLTPNCSDGMALIQRLRSFTALPRNTISLTIPRNVVSGVPTRRLSCKDRVSRRQFWVSDCTCSIRVTRSPRLYWQKPHWKMVSNTQTTYRPLLSLMGGQSEMRSPMYWLVCTLL